MTPRVQVRRIGEEELAALVAALPPPEHPGAQKQPAEVPAASPAAPPDVGDAPDEGVLVPGESESVGDPSGSASSIQVSPLPRAVVSPAVQALPRSRPYGAEGTLQLSVPVLRGLGIRNKTSGRQRGLDARELEHARAASAAAQARDLEADAQIGLAETEYDRAVSLQRQSAAALRQCARHLGTARNMFRLNREANDRVRQALNRWEASQRARREEERRLLRLRDDLRAGLRRMGINPPR